MELGTLRQTATLCGLAGFLTWLGQAPGHGMVFQQPEKQGVAVASREPLPGTALLTGDDDLASRLVAGADRFLLREIDRVTARRARHWQPDRSSAAAYQQFLTPKRETLARMVGLRDPRVAFSAPELVSTTEASSLVGSGEGYEIHAVRWPAVEGVHGEGLLLRPTGRKPVAAVLALPDADLTPEQVTGLTDGVPRPSQYARRLAESGCLVLVPTLIDRQTERRNGRARLTNREYLYRPAFVLGRHLIGYELQKLFAAVDWLDRNRDRYGKIGVWGWGEGGLLALYAAALNPRLDAAGVSGYFDDRRNLWQEPIDRNVFGLLEQFGDAELAAMVAPRPLVIEAARGPEVTLPTEGGAPGRLVTPKPEAVRQEVERARKLTAGLQPPARLEPVTSGDGTGSYGTPAALQAFLSAVAPAASLAPEGPAPQRRRDTFPIAERQQRQIREIDRHTQAVLAESPYVRQQFLSKLDTASPAAFEKSSAEYRRRFYEDVIGRFDYPLLPPNPRTRRAYDRPQWTGYEVVLDVFDEVLAYGILLLPKDLKPGEKRPVVVCQHGLEGRPQQLVEGDHPAYHDYAARLAERGFIVFAPQNPYLFGDRFRTLQRKANPLRKSLFSLITPQHQQILNWLKTLPHVDGSRIGFYGLSYGGKTAMRVPALLTDYALSICSADFNDWVWKNASTRSPYSYVWTGEYEIFEFDLGSTFNYAEMAALIAPRPFMVERGHFDGVAPDEAVAAEFAKVRHLYQARLKLENRCELEWFPGPHTINGKGTFDFLHRHLNWPRR